MEKRIWLYWENLENNPEPPHIKLCRRTVEENSGASVHVVNSENLYEYLPDIHPNIEHIVEKKNQNKPSLAIKTAFIRIFLLEKYGGLYIDSDAIVLKPLDEVFEAIERIGFVSTRKTSRMHRHIPNNFLGSLPDSPIIQLYAKHLRYELTRRSVFEWGEVGAKALTPLVNSNSGCPATHANI